MERLAASSIAFLFLVVASFGQEAEWKEFVFDKSHFAIKFPGEPTQEKSKMAGDGGSRYDYSLAQPEQVLTVRVSELPKTSAPLDEAAMGVLYTISRRGALDWLKGSELISETDIKLDGLSGRQFSIRNEHTFLTRRIFMVDDMLYQVSALVPKKREKDPKAIEAATKFFNSFRLIRAKR